MTDRGKDCYSYHRNNHDASLRPTGRGEQQPRRSERRSSSRQVPDPVRQHACRKKGQVQSLAPLIDGETPFPSVLARTSDSLQSDAATINSGADAEALDSESSESRVSRTKEVPIGHLSEQNRQAAQISRRKNQTDLDNDTNREASTVGVDVRQNRSRESPESSTSSEDKKPRACSDSRPVGEFSRGGQCHDTRSAGCWADRPVAKSSGLSHLALSLGPDDRAKAEETASKEDGASSLEVEMDSSASKHSLYSHDLNVQHSLESGIQGNGDDSKDELIAAPSGRRSPGGTTYVGRGSRQYRGRYINLALRRFHEDGVDPESLHGERSGGGHVGHHVYDPRVDSLQSKRRNPRRGYSPKRNKKERSRSRSRSPPSAGNC